MATARETIGDSLGSAYRRIKARLQAEFLAARGPLKANTPLTRAEVSALMVKIWNAMGRAMTPISPDGSVTIGTQDDINGDPQLTLQASGSTSQGPFALYQFWRGATYGLLDASGNQLDVEAFEGGATIEDLLSGGSGAKFSGGYLRSSDVTGQFQDLGDMSAFVSFQVEEFPAMENSQLVTIDGSGDGDLNALLSLYVRYNAGIATGHNAADGWHGFEAPGVTLEAGRMYTAGVVRTSTKQSLYLDGVLVGSQDMPAAVGGAQSTLHIGGVSWAPGWKLAGSIGSVALYHCALTANDFAIMHREEVLRWGTRFVDGTAVAAHAATHEPGGDDEMEVDAIAATGSLRTLGTGAQQACSGDDARLSLTPLVRTHVGAAGSSTHTFNAKTRVAVIELTGAGGAGGGAAAGAANTCAVGGGGAGGGGCTLWLELKPDVRTCTVVIGAGGTGVANGTGNTGGNSTITYDGTTYTSYGGTGGSAGASGTSVAVVGHGSRGYSSDGVPSAGQDGLNGIRLSGTVAVSGAGGISPRASGGGGAITTAGDGNGVGWGGGGGGGAYATTTTNRAGGGGAPGLSVIYEYA